MLSVSPAMDAGAAGGYFAKEDYYLQGGDAASEWLGKGAEALGLSGPVDKEKFQAVCHGLNPKNGEELVSGKITKDENGEKVETHRAGNDYTFSAPKSVSIAYAAGVEGIKDAHDAAVKAVAEHMEQHYSQARTPEGFQSGTMIAAKFDHATSRAIDPQLHSHVFVANVKQTPDGQFRAGEPINTFKDQKKLGALYRQELAHQLQKQGHEIRHTDREQNMFELGKIDQKTIDTFSQRREAIDKKVEKWKKPGKDGGMSKFEQLQKKGMSVAQIYEKANLGTRAKKDASLSKEDVKQAWDKGFEAAGTSAEKIKADVEGPQKEVQVAKKQVTPDLEKQKTGKTAAEAVSQATEFLIDKEMVIDRAKLLDTAVKISGGDHGIKDLKAEISAQTIKLGEDKGREYLTTAAMLKLEKDNITRAKGMSGSFKSITSKEEINSFLKDLKEKDHIKLSRGQKKMMVNELVGGHGINVSQGDPGVGKTFTLEIIEKFNNEVLLPSNREHVSHNVGFTGRAASEMAVATDKDSDTIDAFLNKIVSGKIKVGEQKDGIQRQEVVRVDEASFVGAKQTDALLRLVEKAYESGANIKLSLQGDIKQRQSISAGRSFGQFIELAKQGFGDYAELKEIQRQSLASGLRPVAEEFNRDDIAASKRGGNALGMLEKQGRVHEIADSKALTVAAAAMYQTAVSSQHPDAKKAEAGIAQTCIIATSTNKEVATLNAAVRENRVAAGEIEQGQKHTVFTSASAGLMASGYEPGQKIMFGGTRGKDDKMHAWGARIGTQGQVVKTDKEKNTVTVKYEKFDPKNAKVSMVEKTFDAAEMANKTSVYNQQERSFSAGDKVMNLMNTKCEGPGGKKNVEVKNGDIGTIKKIDEKGVATVTYNPGEKSERTVFQKLDQAHIDHAYAATVDKLQGATMDSVIVHSDVQPGKMSMSYQAINVAGTRSRHDAQIVTNSIADLKKAISKVDEKTSSLDWKAPYEPDKAKAQAPALTPEQSQKAEATKSAASMIHEAATIARVNKEMDKADKHQEEAIKFSQAHERSGNRVASIAPADIFSHKGKDGAGFGISYSGEHGWETRVSQTASGATGNRTTETIHGNHGKTEKVTTSRGDSFSRSSEVSGKITGKVAVGGRQETVTFKERSSEMLGGLYRSSHRVERMNDAVRTTKSTAWGSSVSGKTTTVHKDGRIVETEWSGKKTNSGLQINSSTTRTYRDDNKAMSAHGNALDRGVRAAIMTGLAIFKPEEYKQVRAEQTGGGYLKISEQKYMKDGSVQGKTQQYAGSEIRKESLWEKSPDGKFEMKESKSFQPHLDVKQEPKSEKVSDPEVKQEAKPEPEKAAPGVKPEPEVEKDRSEDLREKLKPEMVMPNIEKVDLDTAIRSSIDEIKAEKAERSTPEVEPGVKSEPEVKAEATKEQGPAVEAPEKAQDAPGVAQPGADMEKAAEDTEKTAGEPQLSPSSSPEIEASISDIDKGINESMQAVDDLLGAGKEAADALDSAKLGMSFSAPGAGQSLADGPGQQVDEAGILDKISHLAADLLQSACEGNFAEIGVKMQEAVIDKLGDMMKEVNEKIDALGKEDAGMEVEKGGVEVVRDDDLQKQADQDFGMDFGE